MEITLKWFGLPTRTKKSYEILETLIIIINFYLRRVMCVLQKKSPKFLNHVSNHYQHI